MSESLQELSVKLAQIILPIIMLLSIVGNSLNIYILIRPNLRNHACSRYFLSIASNNLIYGFLLIRHLLSNGYLIDYQSLSNILCKIIQYITNINSFLSPYFIVLASIDRFCASSSNAKLRRYSNTNVAYRSILILIICCLLFFIHTLVSYDLHKGSDECSLQLDNILNQIIVLIQIILYAVVPPCLMIIFGLLTIYNTSRLRVLPQISVRYRRTESQLARMLIFQVIVYLILNMPFCIMYLMLALPTVFKPTAKFYFVFSIVAFLFHFSYATTFFLYILSARIYRGELIRLISKIYRINTRNQIEPMSMTHNIRLTVLSRQPAAIIHN